jgi:hypothetical protein
MEIAVAVARFITDCGKIPKMSFRGRGLPEETAFFLEIEKKQIPRFARDDISIYFFRSVFRRGEFLHDPTENPGLWRGELQQMRQLGMNFR